MERDVKSRSQLELVEKLVLTMQFNLDRLPKHYGSPRGFGNELAGRSLEFDDSFGTFDQYASEDILPSEEPVQLTPHPKVQLTPHPEKGVLHHKGKHQAGVLGHGQFQDRETDYDADHYEGVVTPAAPGNVLDLQQLLDQFDTDDIHDLEELDEYQGLSRPKKSKGLLAKYNLPIVKIGQAHSTTDTHNKKLKVKSSSQNLQQDTLIGSSKNSSSKTRPRWNNYHQNLQSKSNQGQARRQGKDSYREREEPGGSRRKAAVPHVSPMQGAQKLVSKPTSEEKEKRRAWRKMRKRLEEDRIKLSMKYEVDMRKEAVLISARKKQMAREASLARQREIQVRIKRIAEEKQKIQLHLVEDLRAKANTSPKHRQPSSALGHKEKKILPKLKGQRSGNKRTQAARAKVMQKKKPGPARLPRLKTRDPATPISDTSRANSWKHVRPRIFTNFKAKFVNRSTSPLAFPSELSTLTQAGIPENSDWKLVCNFNIVNFVDGRPSLPQPPVR